MRRLIGEGPSVPHGGIARCNKGGNLPYHFGLSKTFATHSEMLRKCVGAVPDRRP